MASRRPTDKAQRPDPDPSPDKRLIMQRDHAIIKEDLGNPPNIAEPANGVQTRGGLR